MTNALFYLYLINLLFLDILFHVLVPEFGTHLAEFTVDPQVALAVRQLSSVLLKQYVEAHWSQHSDKFRAPETSEAVSV